MSLTPDDSNNNAIKKLISRLRKRSIDIRGGGGGGDPEADPTQALLAITAGPGSSRQSGGGESSRAGSLSSTPGAKAEPTKSTASGGGQAAARLMTITEHRLGADSTATSPSRTSHMDVPVFTVGGAGASTASMPRRQDSFKYPVLPPLSEAQSVKQKWNILLSKVWRFARFECQSRIKNRNVLARPKEESSTFHVRF